MYACTHDTGGGFKIWGFALSILYQCVSARLQYGLQKVRRSSIGAAEEMIRRPWAVISASLGQRRDRRLVSCRITHT